MVKESFKIGDKVKLRPAYVKRFTKQGTKVGEIIEFNSSYIRVKFAGRPWGFPYKKYEIEHVVRVEEQLEFAFMRTSD
jgi:hypothetical protein